jgi:hypothetical protein
MVTIAVTLLLFASGPSVVDHQDMPTVVEPIMYMDTTTTPGGITSGGIVTGSTRTAEISTGCL